MAYTKTQIANACFAILGIHPVEDIDTETSDEAKAFTNLFLLERNTLLRRFPWRTYTEYHELPLAAVQPDPPPVLTPLAYDLPPNTLAVERVGAAETERAITWRRQGSRILTDHGEPLPVWVTIAPAANAVYEDDAFALCLAARLAMRLAYPLTKSSLKVQEARTAYAEALADAGFEDAAEGTPEARADESSLLTVRG